MPRGWETRPADDQTLLEALRDLPPLPLAGDGRGRHFSWPFDAGLTNRPAHLREVIRILGSASLAIERPDTAVCDAAAAVGIERLAIKLSMGYHRTSPALNDPRAVRDSAAGQEELDALRGTLDELLTRLPPRMRVEVCWIDQERVKVCDPREPFAAEWDEALTWLNDELAAMVRRRFAGCQILQHGRGPSHYYTGREARTGSYVVPLYAQPDIEGCASHYDRLCQQAAKEGLTSVVPVLSLGGGNWRNWYGDAAWQPFRWRPMVAWWWGSWLCHPYFGHVSKSRHLFAAYAARVLFWPEICPDRTAGLPVPAAGEHFVAYVCGAHNLRPTWIADQPPAD